MEMDLTREFIQTAANAYTAFPDELAWLVIMQVPAAEPLVYVSPEIARQLTRETTRIGKILRILANRQSLAKSLEDEAKQSVEYMQRKGAIGIANSECWLSGLRIRRIAMLTGEKTTGEYSARYTREMESLFTLDHEIGHLILRNGSSKTGGAHVKESACDAFAMLRHIQRFGWDTDYTRHWPDLRAALTVLHAETAHYTTASLYEAIEQAREKGDDFFKMSLQETAALATQIADDTAFHEETAKRLKAAFKSAATAYKNNLGDTWDIIQKIREKDKAAFTFICRETVSAMRANKHDPDVLRAGKLFLRRPVLRAFMEEAAAAETITPFWQTALDFIDSTGPALPRLQYPRGPV